MFEYYGHIQYIAPGQGQTTPFGQKFFISIDILSNFLQVLSFKSQFNNFPHSNAWANQGHHRVMIYTNNVELCYLMLHAKFQNHRPSDSGEEDFKAFCY